MNRGRSLHVKILGGAGTLGFAQGVSALRGFVSGHTFRRADQIRRFDGFSRWNPATAAKPSQLEWISVRLEPSLTRISEDISNR